jgi:hypothetical protein
MRRRASARPRAPHREVLRISGGELRAHSHRRRSDEAVRLGQGDAPRRCFAPPAAGESPLGRAEIRDAQAVDQLAASSSSSGRIPRQISSTLMQHTQGTSPEERSSSSRVAAPHPRNTSIRTVVSSSTGNASADPPRIRAPLGGNPTCRIVVPIVSSGFERPCGRRDLLPAALVLERPSERGGDVCAAPARTGPPIELSEELVIEVYVYTHVPTLTHSSAHSSCRTPPQWSATPAAARASSRDV